MTDKTPEPKQNILNNRDAIAKIDVSNALGSVEALADQVKHAWELASSIEFEPRAEIRNVLINGMGGSAIGADVIKHLFKEQLHVPFEVINSYILPNYVNQHTLVIISSYSGNTEEPLNVIDQAVKRKAQIIAITASGKLKNLVDENNYPAFIIKPKYNPSNQPRMAIGYSIFGMIALLSKAGVIKISDEEVQEVITTIIKVVENNKIEVAAENNQAKTLAFACHDKRPILVASEFLVGPAHVATNQCNENAKTFADYKIIPEINHHLMEGLRFPASNKYSHFFIFFNSELYHSRNQKRMKLTQEVVEKNDIETLMITLESETKITQVFEFIALMAYMIFYLTMLEGIDPCPIPHVNWFKKKLK